MLISHSLFALPEGQFIRNSRRKSSTLYYKPEKHAPIRVIGAYGAFLVAVFLIILGLGHYLSPFGARNETPVPEHAAIVNVPTEGGTEPGSDNAAGNTDPSLPIDASPTMPGVAAIDAPADEVPTFDAAVSGHPPPQPWFYSEIGLSPKASASIEAPEGKYTLLLMSSKNLSEAQKLRKNLAKQGIHAFVQKVKDPKGKPKYLVQFGVFRSKRKAGSEKSRLATRFDLKSDIAPLEL